MSLTTAFIGVGSNLGDRNKNIDNAQTALCRSSQICFIQSAPLYETEPVGGPPQGHYLNTVWEVETAFEAKPLLEFLLQVEAELGRIRKEKNEPRVIDLDLLFFGDEVIEEPGLIVPHPKLQERWFVLKPLWDLRSDLVHPVLKKSICELLDQVNAGHKKP